MSNITREELLKYFREEMSDADRHRIEAAAEADDDLARLLDDVARETFDDVFGRSPFPGEGKIELGECDPELVAQVRAETERLAGSEFWSLEAVGGRQAMFEGEGPWPVNVHRRRGIPRAEILSTPEEAFSGRIQRDPGDPNSFFLNAPAWPQGCELLGVRAVRWRPFEREPLEIELPRLEPQVQRKPTTLDHADPTFVRTGLAHGKKTDSGDAKGAAGNQSRSTRENSAFRFTLNVHPKWIGVEGMRARMPLDRSEDFVIGEVEFPNTDGGTTTLRRAYKLTPKRDKRHLSVWVPRADVPELSSAAPDGQIALRFRSLTGNDLYLLGTDEIDDLLAVHHTVSMVAKPADGGFRFRARRDSQQESLGDSSLSWLLQVKCREGKSHA